MNIPSCSFLLEAEKAPGPQCGWEHYVYLKKCNGIIRNRNKVGTQTLVQYLFSWLLNGAANVEVMWCRLGMS
jgi:hypothetical protein